MLFGSGSIVLMVRVNVLVLLCHKNADYMYVTKGNRFACIYEINENIEPL